MSVRKLLFLVLLLFISSRQAVLSGPEVATATVMPDRVSDCELRSVMCGSGFSIVQFGSRSLSQLSYLVVSEGRVLVVDPVRDISVYLDYARRENLEWAGTILTHLHSDFIAGHREIAAATGSPVYASPHSGALFPFVEAGQDDLVEVGKALLKIVERRGILWTAFALWFVLKMLLTGRSLFLSVIRFCQKAAFARKRCFHRFLK
jgi:hypothetical protein